MDQIIAGLADTEIQKDVLSYPEAANLTLEKLLVFIEGKESGQTSLGLMSSESVAAFKVKDRSCRFCGDTHVLGKKFCKAAGKECKHPGSRVPFCQIWSIFLLLQSIKVFWRI